MDNTSLLSRGSKVYAAKRAAKKALIPEISFDEDARRDYLTGFHTRKVARKVASVKAAKEKERLQRIEDRKERREAAAEALSDKMAEYKRLMGNDDDEEEEEEEEEEEGEEGESSSVPAEEGATSTLAKEDEGIWSAQDASVKEFSTVDMLTTVVVTDGLEDEAFEPIPKRNPTKRAREEEADIPSKDAPVRQQRPSKPRPKKFRYESKNERQKKTRKEHSVKSKKGRTRKG